MRTIIRGFERKARRKEFDRIAREVLYSLAIQLRDLLKDDDTIDVFNGYFILNDALQQLFQRSIAVTDSPSPVRKINYGCTHFEVMKNLSESAPIPNECSICPKLVHCYTERTEA